MRWYKPRPIDRGTKRTIVKFAWLPVTISGETRWLERVAIRQEYVSDGCNGGYYYTGWSNIEFDDDWLRQWKEAKIMAKDMA